MDAVKKLYRSRRDRRFAGVAGGLADYLGVDVNLVRLGFIVLTLTKGIGLLIYVAMMLVVPEEPLDEVNQTHA